MDVFITNPQHSLHMLIDGLQSCGLLVGYYNVYSSCLDSHSDGTHSLQRTNWWASDEILKLSQSGSFKKQTHLHLGWSEGEYIFSIFKFLGDISSIIIWSICKRKKSTIYIYNVIHCISHKLMWQLKTFSMAYCYTQ